MVVGRRQPGPLPVTACVFYHETSDVNPPPFLATDAAVLDVINPGPHFPAREPKDLLNGSPRRT